MASKFQIPVAFKSDPRGLQQAEGALAGFGKKLAGIGAAVAGAFAVRAVFRFGKEAILAAEQVSTANNTLIAVAKATGVFGAETDKVTKSLISFAKAQEMRIGVDENVVKNVQAQLLSFKKLSVSAGDVGGVFERTTKAAFDMAVVLKKDAGSQALALGKALEDPVRGLTALRRGGTVFTEEQQKVIKALVDSNDLLGAQTLILDELESQYGGAAEASANWSDKLRLAFENVKESVGAALTPAFERFAIFLTEKVLPPVQKFFDEDFPVMLSKFGAMTAGLTTALAPIGKALREAFEIPDNVSLLESLLDSIANLPDNPLFMELVDSIVKLTPALLQLIPPLTQLVLQLIPLLVSIIPAVIWFVDLLTAAFGEKGLAGGIQEAIDGGFGWEKSVANLKVAADVMTRIIEAVAVPWSALTVAINKAVDAAKRYFDAIRSGGRIPGAPGVSLPVRAVGGPVTGDRSYLVGERGPEVFTPSSGGFITPNNRLGGGSSTVVNITVNAGMGTDGARVGEEIVSAIRKFERVSGPVFARA
jgi:hypothetical protein